VRLFLTGTDTNVGKTYVAALLIRALRQAGVDAIGMKPICCGGREDAEELHAASDGVLDLNEVNPVWLRTPAAPYTAAMIENRTIDLALIRETFVRLRDKFPALIVEGVGGWLVPIARDYSVRDLAGDLNLSVAIVVANRLGAINHTLLTVEAIRNTGLTCAGLIYNHSAPLAPDEAIATETNRSIIEDLTGLPTLFEIAHGQRTLTLAAA